MIDTVVRQIGNTAEIKEPVAVARESSVDGEAKVEVPFTEYEAQEGIPFVVDYFNLGEKWDVFVDEVTVIEDYIQELIDSGEIANNIDTVRDIFKRMEKLLGIKDEKRTVVKIETIKAHVDFLNETTNIKENFTKYGN